MQLFYTANLTENTRQITFNNIESRHIVRVLRKKTGDLLHITDGKGMLYTAKIVLAND
ncbi:MAG TPA: 16S rRNA (uracil(1498)-N(3))-methyltransferase, partial [Flavobacteriia bacterium]|nr:16S rRNA (uracil(1498)-N(3))-methyltransferase [Flavobacteriia bacterium]